MEPVRFPEINDEINEKKFEVSIDDEDIDDRSENEILDEITGQKSITFSDDDKEETE